MTANSVPLNAATLRSYMEGATMLRLFSILLLCTVIAVGIALTGCGGTTTDDGGGTASNLLVLSGQVLHAQELQDGSVRVTPEPLLAAGGAPFSGYNWTIASGSAFPPGTSVTVPTGVFDGSGNGLVGGRNYPFNVQVSDGTRTATGTVTLQVADPGEIPALVVFQQPMGVPVINLPAARANVPYGASLQVMGGDPPYTWLEDTTYAGRGDFQLSGLTIDMARGIVRGTPMNSASGKTLRFKLVVRDSTGATAATDGVGPVYQIAVQ